jgi:RNA-directed DNA polymerase
MFFEDTELLFSQWLKEERQKLGRAKPFVGERHYRHFDGHAQLAMVESGEDPIATALRDPASVAKHSFYPFLRDDQRRRRFVSRLRGDGIYGPTAEQKVRPIMYASHHDALVYSFYAYILRRAYDQQIAGTALDKAVIAYRRIRRDDDSGRGKSNIDFALDVHKLAVSQRQCAVICLDIKGFFDNMSHELIKQRWEGTLKVAELPEDHYRVFRSITHFHYVFLQEALEALAYGKIVRGKFKYYDGANRRGRLCGPKAFRNKIKPLEHINASSKGIPQGSPISDVLANIYLEEFDREVLARMSLYDFGWYRRYSDDIVIICPVEVAEEVYRHILDLIKKDKLTIGVAKTEAVVLNNNDMTVRDITYSLTGHPDHERRRHETFQYLGFEMDATGMHVRAGTVAKHYRRAKRRAKAQEGLMTAASSSGVGSRTSTGRKIRNRSRWQYFINVTKRTGSARIKKQASKMLRRVRSFGQRN